MNFELSVIIICKNEKGSISYTLETACAISKDVVVYDSGSTDGTLEIIARYPVRLFQGEWLGFGPTRQKAASLANNTWVMVLDADESLSSAGIKEIQELHPKDPRSAYSIQLFNHLGPTHIKWGAWSNDWRVRIYNRYVLSWDDSIIHEQLVVPENFPVTKLKNHIHHRTADDIEEFGAKMIHYARLTAEQYHNRGKRSTWIKRKIGPPFTFIRNYIFFLGFLDGKNGFDIARIMAQYNYLKYSLLHKMRKRSSA